MHTGAGCGQSEVLRTAAIITTQPGYGTGGSQHRAPGTILEFDTMRTPQRQVPWHYGPSLSRLEHSPAAPLAAKILAAIPPDELGQGGFGQAIGNIMQGTDIWQTVQATLARTWRFSDQM